MTASRPIYMDHHATTPVDPRVLEQMLPYFTHDFGNAASRNHAYGWTAEKAVQTARERIAELIGATAREMVFTSGATESNNLALLGAAQMYASKGKHLVSMSIEHKSVLDPLKRLQKQGFEVTIVPVDRQGRVKMAELEAALRTDTIVISVMAANNEVGTLQPVVEIGKLAKARQILFHCDATQAVGRVPVDVEGWGVDLLSLSAHKMYGPKGVGALYVRNRAPRVRLMPLFEGGGHERGLRSGTMNVPGIVGLGQAAAIARAEMATESARLAGLCGRLHDGITARLMEVTLNGHPTERLAGNLNVSFSHVDGEALMMSLPEIALSSGSACTSATLEPSYVLRAMGIRDDLAQASLRFGLGRFNTDEEVDTAIAKVVAAVEKLRSLSPTWRRRAEEPACEGART